MKPIQRWPLLAVVVAVGAAMAQTQTSAPPPTGKSTGIPKTVKVGKTVYSRSGKNLPIGRPKRIFNRQRVIELSQVGPVFALSPNS